MGKRSRNAGQHSPAPPAPQKGAAGFEAYYQRAWNTRWAALKQALLSPPVRTARVNAFADHNTVGLHLTEARPLDLVPGCFQLPTDTIPDDEKFTPGRDAQQLLSSYVMDPASVLAARQVDVAESSRVLDLCAAPGGKSLILAERFAAHGQLVLNDRSPLRRKRLLQVLKDYVPEAVRARIRVHAHDGRLWGKREALAYDAILLDAPCSSEQHVLRDVKELALWSPKRIQRLSRDQLSLLRSAFAALRPGGLLIYCTCALADDENDGVIEELLRRDPSAQVAPLQLPIGEPTRYGWHILPDKTGFGPLFIARLNKSS
ncbi:MAG TPA: RsmB/NOP family class I SAM-dependent RNA methyltransferase [Polyangiaceae bacterium]|nr:RsmB/NOP family class I SAM-dependent RNA methyltransferase [Polyangiaceae bacterium]